MKAYEGDMGCEEQQKRSLETDLFNCRESRLSVLVRERTFTN